MPPCGNIADVVFIFFYLFSLASAKLPRGTSLLVVLMDFLAVGVTFDFLFLLSKTEDLS
jgi:hypothetical protein